MKDNVLHKLSETLALVTHELREIRSDECGPFRSGHELATKRDLDELKKLIVADHSDFRDLFCRILEKPVKPNPVRPWLLTTEADEPITKENNMKLTKPIKPNFRRPFTVTPDEAVDKRPDGTFFAVEVLEGDSTVTIDPTSTATSLKGWFNGDGATGEKAVKIIADGHLGEGEISVTLNVEYTVGTPDATLLTLTEGADEPMPAPAA